MFDRLDPDDLLNDPSIWHEFASMIAAALTDRDYDVRQRARQLLQDLTPTAPPDTSIALLRRASRDPWTALRQAAMRVVAERFSDRPEALPLLTRATKDFDPQVRAHAESGLTRARLTNRTGNVWSPVPTVRSARP